MNQGRMERLRSEGLRRQSIRHRSRRHLKCDEHTDSLHRGFPNSRWLDHEQLVSCGFGARFRPVSQNRYEATVITNPTLEKFPIDTSPKTFLATLCSVLIGGNGKRRRKL